ncbi:MAG: LCP family protein [Firmicutes bacterium]|nr:LCP family protein [Bacillota bacterium]
MKKNDGGKKKSVSAIFFKIFLTIVIIYTIAFGCYVAYTYTMNGGEESGEGYFKEVAKEIFPDAFVGDVPDRTNILLLGVDADETRTDTIMLASYDSVNKNVSLISIPRDTIVTIGAVEWELMTENEPSLMYNYSPQMKINSVHAYLGPEEGVKYLKELVGEMFDIKIDYYAKVNCEAFRYIVDSIGGIEYNVEERLYYEDPTQDLFIDLYPGVQMLDGDKAEQLVRFRYGYATQDLHRVEVQRNFMKVFMATALNKDTIMSNPGAYAKVLIDYVDTDMPVATAVRYVNSLSGFSAENVKGYTLPGECAEIDGVSYYVRYEDETDELAAEVFVDPKSIQENNSEGTTEEKITESSSGKLIQVLNGGYTSGMAGYVQGILEAEGFAVSAIGDYGGEKINETVIYVSKEGQGEDLVKYFTNARTEVSAEMTGGYDIVIVVGTEEQME